MWFVFAGVTAPPSAPWESKAAGSSGFGGLEGTPVTGKYCSFVSCIQNKTIRFLEKKKFLKCLGFFQSLLQREHFAEVVLSIEFFPNGSFLESKKIKCFQ